MMKARDQQADPMKSPRLVTMLALACSGPSKKPLGKKSNAYIARIFWDCSSSLEKKQANVYKNFIGKLALSPRGESV